MVFAEKVGSGDLDHRAKVTRADEAGRLAAAFNVMSERLSNTMVSKAFVDNVIRSMGESLVVTGKQGQIVSVNEAALKLLGYSRAELIGQDIGLIAPGRIAGPDVPATVPEKRFCREDD